MKKQYRKGIMGIINSGDGYMDNRDIINRIEELERDIACLPVGNLTVKKVNDKKYYYLRINKDGDRKEEYVDFEKAEILKKDIAKRKLLEKELKALKKELAPSKKKKTSKSSYKFRTYVRIDEQLVAFSEGVKNYKKRECYKNLYEYVFGNIQDRVFILYGLRRTGKTTLIRQIILNMSSEELAKSAFIQVKRSDTLSDINSDLKYLQKTGYKYVFIDEVTLMEDFIEGAALFSDIYASSGMKIVLSGTDSLGFTFTKSDQLYDRCIMLHTTFIPYREFEKVLGIKGIDEYIQYGGTMSMSGINYNETSSFATRANTDEYIDSAIARNIQHSLKYYNDGSHFRHLYNLYEKNELTSAINRVIEDINHRFTKEVLERTFKSNDLAVSARNLLKDRENPVDLIENIDISAVTQSIMGALDIINKEKHTVDIETAHAQQIKEYLQLLDLIQEVDLNYLPDVNAKDKITVICQPGMRYTQAEALVRSLMMDEKFNNISAVERKRITDRILSEVKGRMMEEIVLLETKLSNPNKEVFQLKFAVGEFDMVVCDPEKLECEIYEIKHSTQISPQQYRHLEDAEKCNQTEFRYGTIVSKNVIYRGKTCEVDGIKYLNVEEYLNSL